MALLSFQNLCLSLFILVSKYSVFSISVAIWGKILIHKLLQRITMTFHAGLITRFQANFIHVI